MVVVVTFSGVPMVGGIVICGRTDWILFVTKTPLTREVMRLDFPVPSSPQTQIRTAACHAWLGHIHFSRFIVCFHGLHNTDL